MLLPKLPLTSLLDVSFLLRDLLVLGTPITLLRVLPPFFMRDLALMNAESLKSSDDPS